MNEKITINDLFRNNEPILNRIVSTFEVGTSPEKVAKFYIAPIIHDLEENVSKVAGRKVELDAEFVALWVQRAIKEVSQKENVSQRKKPE